MYDVIDIAKIIIDYGIRTYSCVTNLRLQYLLYFLWIDYYREHQKELFFNRFKDEKEVVGDYDIKQSSPFIASSFGPCSYNVYYRYCCWAGSPITARQDFGPICLYEYSEIGCYKGVLRYLTLEEVDEDALNFIHANFEKYKQFSTVDFIKIVKSKGPWKEIYEQDNREKWIPKNLLKGNNNV